MLYKIVENFQKLSSGELQELIELKAELNRMYQQVAATRTAATTGPPQQQ